MGPSVEPSAPSDSELISRVRAGDQRAQELLFARHYDVALHVARRHSNSSYEVEDLVSAGFEKVFAVLRTEHGPDAFFRAYLCTTVSRLAFAYNNREKQQSLVEDFTSFDTGADYADPVMNQFESGVIGRAFRTLPERWQAVLWYTEIDGLKPAEIAPLLGLSANGVSALAVRAREGLRQAYLQGHIKESTADGCHAFSRQLGAYSRGGLSARNEAKVDEHLAECNKCTAILLQVNDVGASMRGIIAPLFLGGITALGIPAAVSSVSVYGSGLAGAGVGTGTVSGAVGTGAAATAGAVSGSTVLSGIGTFVAANALALVVAGAAVAASVVATVVGVSVFGGNAEANRRVDQGQGTGSSGITGADNRAGVIAPDGEWPVSSGGLAFARESLPSTSPFVNVPEESPLLTSAPAVDPSGLPSTATTHPNPASSDAPSKMEPADVTGPTSPTTLTESTAPTAPTGATETMSSSEPTTPTEATEPTEPTVEPTEPTEPTVEPTEPTEPTVEPTEPTEPTTPTEPTEPTPPTVEPTEPTIPTEPTTPTEATEPTEPTTPTEPTEPTVEPTEPTVEPTEPAVEPTEPTVEPTEPTEPTTPTEPTVEPTEPAVEPTEPAVEPTVEPTESTVEPTVEPTEPTVEPTEPAVEPTEPTEPTTPTEPTVEPTEPTVDPTTEPTPPIDIEHGDTSSTITINTSSFGFINLLRAEFEKISGPGSSDVTVSSRAWCRSDGSLSTPTVFSCLQLGNGKFTFDVKKTDPEAIEATVLHVKISGFGGSVISKDFIIE